MLMNNLLVYQTTHAVNPSERLLTLRWDASLLLNHETLTHTCRTIGTIIAALVTRCKSSSIDL
jgi:hypothetical protein